MLEFLSAAYSFWSYLEDANTFVKLIKFCKLYLSFLYWWYKNPEVKIKYSTILNLRANDKTIENIYQSLVSKDKSFSDGFSKNLTKMNFEIQNSKLSYRVQLDKINNTTHKLIFETHYVPFYPIRRLKSLNSITTEFNEIYGIISQPLIIKHSDQVIFVELNIVNNNEEIQKFESAGAEIIFKGNKVQITNLKGTEHAELLFFFVMKWLKDYRTKENNH